ncbi:MFS transporter [Alkalihalophilus pseudofirmus]|uniref:MFS transporter n=1 Tax=Alkalihalophilus pseudofirmus TaxID=79885 RepID=A0AAJ2KTG3_ALKPS|nr:MFS transporter [Alkalihalophilus pseudofirmus]MDV2884741.1 MFS transporter [Alkalihalophilus pseudofirmus]
MSDFNRSFKLMVAGQVITMFGASVLRFALSLYILDLTESATIFGAILALSIVPTILISPIGGAIADRFNKKRLMVTLDTISGTLIAMFALILASGHINVMTIAILMTALTLISALYQPAVQSSIPVLVPKELLMKSNGIISGVMSISNFVGPIVGGVLYSFANINAIVIVSAICFFFASFMEIFMKIPFKKSPPQPLVKMVITDIKGGLMYIIHENRFIFKSIFVTFIVSLFIAPMFFVGLPYLVKILLDMPDTYFGFTQSGISLSIIFSAMTIGMLKGKIQLSNLYLWIVGCGGVYLIMAASLSGIFSSSFIQYLVVTLSSMLVMFALTVVNIFINTKIQEETPGNLLGKVMAIQITAGTTAVPIGQMLFGFLVDGFSNQIYLLIFGVGILTLIISIGVQRMYRKRVSKPLVTQQESPGV